MQQQPGGGRSALSGLWSTLVDGVAWARALSLEPASDSSLGATTSSTTLTTSSSSVQATETSPVGGGRRTSAPQQQLGDVAGCCSRWFGGGGGTSRMDEMRAIALCLVLLMDTNGLSFMEPASRPIIYVTGADQAYFFCSP